MKKRWMIYGTLLLAILTTGFRFGRIQGNRWTYGILGITKKVIMGRSLEEGVEEGCILTRVINKKGSKLSRHEIVVWDDTPISVVDTVARASACDTLTIANGLGSEGGYYDLRTETYSLANACTLEITGEGIAQGTLHGSIIPTASAVVESVIHTATGAKFSEYRWDTLTQIRLLGADANDSVHVNAFTFAGVTTTTSAGDVKVAGVVWGYIPTNSAPADTIPDNYEGYIVTYGAYYAKVNCSSTEGKPGMYVQTLNSAGKGAPNATETTGAGIGYLLEAGNTDGTYAIFVNKE